MTSERALPVSGPVALTPASAAQSAAIKKMLIPLALGPDAQPASDARAA